MYKHHEETINTLLKKLKVDEEIEGILLSGSIAHGFESKRSDVDIMIIVSEENFEKRCKSGKLTYWNNELCSYDGGYVDGKYISVSFMEKVADYGSEPSKFAFQGAKVLYSKLNELESLLSKTIKYPINNKETNINRFYAQFQAWKWYCYEAIKHNNLYLLDHSISNYILFGGRLILAYNEILYPYHKWFLKVLNAANEKPKDLESIINNLLSNKNKENIENFYDAIINFTNWNVGESNWPNQFAMDSELTWMYGNIPVSDI